MSRRGQKISVGQRRMVALTTALLAGSRLSTAYVRDAHKVSKATAKRDLALLEDCLPVESVNDGGGYSIRLRAA